LAAVRARVAHAPAGDTNERKALVQALVDRITVDSRASIRPTFRFPTALTGDDGKSSRPGAIGAVGFPQCEQ
jgi:hypothetical protein